MVWSADVELDEIILEAKTMESSKEKEAVDISQAGLARKNGENDKDALISIVKQLLVCSVPSFSHAADKPTIRLVERFNLGCAEKD